MYILTFAIVSLFLVSSCSEEKNGKDEKKDEKKIEKTDETVNQDGLVDELMSIEAIAEKRAILDCKILMLSKTIESLEDSAEKTILREELAAYGDEINTLNIEFAKYEGNQEDMEIHQKIYKEKIKDCK